MSTWLVRGCERKRCFLVRAVAVLIVTAAMLILIFSRVYSSPNSGTGRVYQMEAAISHLRDNNNSAELRIDAIVKNYFHDGDDILIAENELRAAGYTIQEMAENRSETLIAEKTVCRHHLSLPGFCDQIRIIFLKNKSEISQTKGFVFFQSL